jgi:hypothetical protein
LSGASKILKETNTLYLRVAEKAGANTWTKMETLRDYRFHGSASKESHHYQFNQLHVFLCFPQGQFTFTDCTPPLTSELFTVNKNRLRSPTQTPSDGKKPKCSCGLRG